MKSGVIVLAFGDDVGGTREARLGFGMQGYKRGGLKSGIISAYVCLVS